MPSKNPTPKDSSSILIVENDRKTACLAVLALSVGYRIAAKWSMLINGRFANYASPVDSHLDSHPLLPQGLRTFLNTTHPFGCYRHLNDA